MGGGEVKACEQGQAMRNVGSNRAEEPRDTGLRRPMLRGRARDGDSRRRSAREVGSRIMTEVSDSPGNAGIRMLGTSLSAPSASRGAKQLATKSDFRRPWCKPRFT